MTLTVDDLRGHVESSLGDDALGLLLDAAYEAIDKVLGPAGYDGAGSTVSEYLTTGPGPLLMLSRPASAITSVLEGPDETALASDDYALVGDQLVRRLDTGTNPRSRWLSPVQPVYEAVPDASERDRAAIALVKLDLNHEPGVASERLNDHSITFSSSSDAYTADRDAILGSLAAGFVAK